MALVRTIKLRVLSGVAKPGPSIGQALGPLGINMMEFCKVYLILHIFYNCYKIIIYSLLAI